MPYAIDAGVALMKAPRLKFPFDRALAQATIEKLPARDDPVLLLR